jgi:hypothetical protein
LQWDRTIVAPQIGAMKLKVRVDWIDSGLCLQCELRRPFYIFIFQGGDNPEWIGWEQSFNCGRDKGIFELIGRVAGWNNAVLFYMASGKSHFVL